MSSEVIRVAMGADDIVWLSRDTLRRPGGETRFDAFPGAAPVEVAGHTYVLDAAGTLVDLDAVDAPRSPHRFAAVAWHDGWYGLRFHGPIVSPVQFALDSPDAEPIECDPVPVGWPVNPAAPARWDEGWPQLGASLTANRFGVVACAPSGQVWVSSSNGERCWRIPPFFGSLTGHAYDGGVVLTAHYPTHRTADVVWLDHDGIWRDAQFLSEVDGVSPVVPVGDGFVGGHHAQGRGELRRYGAEPSRARVSHRAHGGPIFHLATDHDCTNVAVAFAKTVAVGNGEQLATAEGWPDAELEPVEVLAPSSPCREWSYELRDDPDLGRVPTLSREDHDAVLQIASDDPRRLPDLVPAFLQYRGPLDGVGHHALTRLARDPWPRNPSYSTLARILTRLATEDVDPPLETALRHQIPVQFRHAEVQQPVQPWLDAQLLRMHPETSLRMFRRPVQASWARLRGDLREWPQWTFEVGKGDVAMVTWWLWEALPAHALHDTSKGRPVQGRYPGGPLERGQLSPLSHGCIVSVRTQQMDLFTVATVPPAVVTDAAASPDEAVAAARRHVRVCRESGSELPFWVGRWQGEWALSFDPGRLEDATEVEAGPIDSEEAWLFDALRPSLELQADAEPLVAAWTAALGLGIADVQAAARALEHVLLEHAKVEALSLSTEELTELIERARADG